MRITGIHYKKGRTVDISLDGRNCLTLDKETWASSAFQEGDSIGEEDIEQLVFEFEQKSANIRALQILSQRNHSKAELRRKLLMKSGEAASTIVLERMERLKLIDDRQFAREYAEDLLRRKNMSLSRIRYELIAKGVDKEVADEILSEFNVNPRQQITELLKTRFSGKISEEKEKRRTASALIRLGFLYEDIRAVLNEFCETDDFACYG